MVTIWHQNNAILANKSFRITNSIWHNLWHTFLAQRRATDTSARRMVRQNTKHILLWEIHSRLSARRVPTSSLPSLPPLSVCSTLSLACWFRSLGQWFLFSRNLRPSRKEQKVAQRWFSPFWPQWFPTLSWACSYRWVGFCSPMTASEKKTKGRLDIQLPLCFQN